MSAATISLRSLCLPLAIALSLYAPSALTQDVDSQRRIERLEATVEELTFKLSKALTENQRMEKVLKAALLATRRGAVAVSGCDVPSFERARAYDNWDIWKSIEWAKKEAKNCTKAQLTKLIGFRHKVGSSGYSSVISYELSQR